MVSAAFKYEYVPLTSSDDLCLLFCFYPSSMVASLKNCLKVANNYVFISNVEVNQAIPVLAWSWWLIGSAPDFWGRGPGPEFGISHNDPCALQGHCVIM